MSKSAWVTDGGRYKGTCTPKTAKRCPIMRMALARTTRGPGLDAGVLFDFAAGRGQGVIVYRKTAAEAGVVVRFCPFCGGSTDPPKLSPSKANKPAKAAAKRS